MSSPTSPRLRSCRSGRPARRPVQSLAPGGWFCHTCLRALVEHSLCSLQGPSMGARTFDRPTTHIRRLKRSVASYCQPKPAARCRLRRPVPPACAGVRASTGSQAVARPRPISQRWVARPPAGIAASGHRKNQGCRAWEPTCTSTTLAGDRRFGRNHRHASCCRRPTGHPTSMSRVRHRAGGLPLTRGCGAFARATVGTWGRPSTCGPGPKSLPTSVGASGSRNPPRVDGARSTVAGRPLPNPTHEQGLSPSCTLSSPLAAGVGPPVTPGIAPGGSRVRNTPNGRAAREGVLQK
jgi:hypothetical protein